MQISESSFIYDFEGGISSSPAAVYSSLRAEGELPERDREAANQLNANSNSSGIGAEKPAEA